MSAIRTVLRKDGGFTLAEVAIIVLVLAILAAIMIPQIGAFNRLVRIIKVKEDLVVLCTMMKVMLDNTGFSEFLIDPQDSTSTPIGLLVGDGEVPTDNLNPGGSVGPDGAWDLVQGVDDPFDEDTDQGTTVAFEIDFFDNHLIENDPDDTGDDTKNYTTPNDLPAGFNAFFAWRGPYINDRIEPDPYGVRYASNVFALHREDFDDGYTSGVVCFSAGPNKEAETVFNQPNGGAAAGGNNGWVTGGDDFTVVLASGGSLGR